MSLGFELSSSMGDRFSQTLPTSVLTAHVAFTEAVSAVPMGASPTITVWTLNRQQLRLSGM